MDRLIAEFDRALRAVAGVVHAERPSPAARVTEIPLEEAPKAHAAALMRVNHVGEICAQALYQGQALTARHAESRQALAQAAREEEDHLAWTQARLEELASRPSLLNPAWYAGAFGLGVAAGLIGDRANLGFVVETERQVEEHLTAHMDALPAADAKSRAIVDQMREDEARHGAMAYAAGGASLPFPVRFAMRRFADVMRAVAYRI